MTIDKCQQLLESQTEQSIGKDTEGLVNAKPRQAEWQSWSWPPCLAAAADTNIGT